MKKLLFIMLAATFIVALSNCNGDDAGSGFDLKDSISRTTAMAMYHHYMDSNVNRDDTALIRQIFPPVASLKKVLKTNHLVGIKYLIGAYLDTDPVVARRNKPMVMMQLKIDKGGTITYVYYDLKSLVKKVGGDDDEDPYCPPPPACSIEG